MSRVLLPANLHPNWARSVSDVVAETEDPDTTAVVAHFFTEAELASAREGLGPGESRGLDALATQKPGVEAAVDRLERSDLSHRARGYVHDDDLAAAIVDAVEATGARRVYMYSRRRSPTGRAVFGSALQDVLLDAEVPVVVTPSNAR